MIKSFAQQLLAEELLHPNDRVVVGVSGGADSMALLHLLLDLNRVADWHLSLHIAHLNHALREEEAEADAAFVQALADSHGIRCTIDTRPIRELADKRGVSLEEAGRQERYALFERACLQSGAKVVALGHHADDNAETILQRVLRGTGLRGLAGIPRSRPLSPASDIRVIRPLLRWTRSQIRTYLADAGVAYREDRTNTEQEALRNRIRYDILPRLAAEVNPQVREALLRLGEQAQWMDQYLRETVQRMFETLIVSRTDQVLTMNADSLSRKSRIVQAELVRSAYRSFGLGEQDLSFAHLVAALELIADPASGKRVQFPGGMALEKRYHQLLFSLPTEEPRETIAADVAVHAPGRTLLPLRKLEITCEVCDVTAAEIPRLRRAAQGMREFVDFEAVRLPLIVRARRPGDRFFPLGAPGSKKVSDFLADAKVAPQERREVAVLCDQLGPIWIIGHRIDDRVKMTALTKRILRLTARTLP